MFLNGMPGLGAMGGEGLFNLEALPDGHNCPAAPGMPECCPHGNMKMVMPFLGMGMAYPCSNLCPLITLKRWWLKREGTEEN